MSELRKIRSESRILSPRQGFLQIECELGLALVAHLSVLHVALVDFEVAVLTAVVRHALQIKSWLVVKLSEVFTLSFELCLCVNTGGGVTAQEGLVRPHL